MIVTTLIIGYSYAIELFMAWYSRQSLRGAIRLVASDGFLVGSTRSSWSAMSCCRCCSSSNGSAAICAAFVISLFVNVGMWSERLWIVITATWHDFLPHNWGWYSPTWVELTILGGSFCFFFFGFLVLTKFLPAAPMSDIKTDTEEEQPKKRVSRSQSYMKSSELATGVVGVFGKSADLLDAVDKVRDHALQGLDTYTPRRVEELALVLGRGKSPVRYWTLIGVLTAWSAALRWPSARPSSRV